MNIVNPQIFLMAFFTFCISAGGWGILLYRMGLGDRKLIWVAGMMLPFSFLVNILVKGPVNQLVVNNFDIPAGFSIDHPFWYFVFVAFLPPVTEELVKIVSLLVPKFRTLTKTHALWVGAWSGLGFGLGEILYLAWGVSLADYYQGLPWYAYTGFLGERVAVCLIHAILTAIFFNFICQGKALRGYGLVVLLHLGVNIGALLIALNLIQAWVSNITLAVMLVILVLLFEKYRKQWEKDNSNTEIRAETIYFQRNQTENK